MSKKGEKSLNLLPSEFVFFFFFFFNKSERDTSCRPNYENNNDDSHKSSTWKPSQTQLFSECCAAQHKRVYR